MNANTIWDAARSAMILKRGKKEANGCADADRYGNRRRDEHAEEYGNVACQREGHRAQYDTRHKHRDNNANGTKNTGQHHVVQLVFVIVISDTIPFRSLYL
ncbi:hypothetical protein [Agathobaculum butyriciproducens]|uniref:hypothetical protein n=1 Tax=Agathobaculum butyriciproducens TaxID=1628085 RepID=UPI0036D2BF9A